jgi:hypothetical protein
MNASHERTLTRIARLVFGKVDWSRTFLFIVHYGVNPRAHADTIASAGHRHVWDYLP